MVLAELVVMLDGGGHDICRPQESRHGSSIKEKMAATINILRLIMC
jgi:hypothetical protein